MAYSTNYADLRADIVRITEDTSDDLANNLDTIIALNETTVLRDLDLEIFQSLSSVGNLTPGSATFARPGGIIKINQIWLSDGDAKPVVRRRTLGYCMEFLTNSPLAQSRPRYFSERDMTSILFVPTPDAAYAVNVQGIERPDGLSAMNTVTWLSEYAGDLLLTACLVGAEEYLTNPDQVGVWKSEYGDKLLKAKLELRGASRATYEAARAAGQAASPL